MRRLGGPLAADLEHVRIDVRHHHARPVPREAEGDVAGASGHVEDRLALAWTHPPDEQVLPLAVEAPRHQVVHQVVAPGHA
jgi:hypothetical protein